jgi:uncharacterized membrane protein YhaH (DUF805 family)
MEFSQAVKTCFKKKYFTISGRASRSEHWWFQVFIWGSIILAGTVLVLLIGATGGSEGLYMLVLIATSIFYIILIPPSITATVRRFHDIDMSGWWVLGFLIFNVIPYLGVISALVMLYFLIKKGTSGDNRFGPDPVGNPPSASTDPVMSSAQASITTAPRQNETYARTVSAEPMTVTKLPAAYQTLETKANSGEGLLDQFAKAKTRIEYSPVAGAAWRRVSALSPDLQEVFLRCLEDDPKYDITSLASDLEDRHEASLSPYDDIEANKALAVARSVSPDAEAEFRKVYDLLEGVETVQSIIDQVMEKFHDVVVGQATTFARQRTRDVSLLQTAYSIGDTDGMITTLHKLGYQIQGHTEKDFSGAIVGSEKVLRYNNKREFIGLVRNIIQHTRE